MRATSTVPPARGVRVEQRVEVGDRLLRVAGPDPGEVLHRVAEVRELEVEQGGEVLAVVEEVAGSGVALHDRRRPVDVGHVCRSHAKQARRNGSA